MSFNDTGMNLPETTATLRAQQQQLIDGRRPAQMFPQNTAVLPLPDGFVSFENDRGVFHFNPAIASADDVARLSDEGRENLLLAMGPYNKSDVAKRIMLGEPFLVVTERTPDGVEVKAAAGTPSIAAEQIAEFEKSKSPGSVISVETIEQVLLRRLAATEERAA